MKNHLQEDKNESMHGKEKLNDIYYNVMVDKVKFNQNHYINFNRQKLFLQFLEKIQ